MPDDKPKLIECPKCHGHGKTLPEFASLDDLVKFVMKEPNQFPWRPGWFYNQTGDMIEAYWKDCATTCVQSGFTHPSGIGIMREHLADGKYGEIVGIQIHGVIGRICAEAKRAAYIRPAPREPLKCHVCGWAPPPGPQGVMIYSKDPIECEKCGSLFGGQKDTTA